MGKVVVVLNQHFWETDPSYGTGMCCMCVCVCVCVCERERERERERESIAQVSKALPEGDRGPLRIRLMGEVSKPC